MTTYIMETVFSLWTYISTLSSFSSPPNHHHYLHAYKLINYLHHYRFYILVCYQFLLSLFLSLLSKPSFPCSLYLYIILCCLFWHNAFPVRAVCMSGDNMVVYPLSPYPLNAQGQCQMSNAHLFPQPNSFVITFMTFMTLSTCYCNRCGCAGMGK